MSGPAGPTGVIVLKKIADRTYEQYGAITLSESALTQVTVSQTVLQTLQRFNPETQIIWQEDFFSRISKTNQNEFVKGWPSGSWNTQGAGDSVMLRLASVSGSVEFETGVGSALGGVQAFLGIDGRGSTGKVISNVDRLPTYYMRWAQVGTGAGGSRGIGWHWVDGLNLNNTAFGIFFRHNLNDKIEGVTRVNNFEITRSSGIDAANGVYHNGRIVISRTLGTAMIMGEYTGDGQASQTLHVVNYTPICVWVMGKNAAGNEIGAFRITGMPGSQSHPWVNNPASGAASRLNRIISLNVDGFTVGTSLNVGGDHYFYIVFPSISGFTAAGTYAGNGWTREGAVQIDTTGGNFHVTAGSQFGASDSGQVMVRISDGATIGTIATVTNGSNATGTINIVDVFPSGTWRWQPRQIPIGFVPDMLMICSTSGLGAGNAAPAQCAPGRGLSDDISAASGTTQSFDGTSLSPGNVTVQTDSQTLEVRNNDPSSTPGFNGSGKDYYWFAFKSGSPSVQFEKIDYTGDGGSSRNLTGASFTPGFFMGFGKNDLPKFKIGSSNVTTGTNDYPFSDGSALVADAITFGAGTVSLGVGDLNVSSRLYRAYVATDSGAVAGYSATFYLDNVAFGVISENIPNNDLKPAMTQSLSSGNSMDVDYMAMIQNRSA